MDTSIRTPSQMGARIADARVAAGLTQAALAETLGIDRTSVVRLEAGDRKVSAEELATVAQALGRPIDWFVLEAPSAVVSRRSDPHKAHASTQALDVAIDIAARDVQFLLDRRVLDWFDDDPEPVPQSHEAAEELASELRRRLDIGDEPIRDLGSVAERLGVVAFSLDLADQSDGSCVELTSPADGRLGAAVINGSQDPGRRRWTLAHELGHFIVGDAYAGDRALNDVEQYLNSFVSYLLMPRTGALRTWQELHEQGDRVAALALSARYQTSWTAACSHLVNLDLVDRSRLEVLKQQSPTLGDYMALGESWDEELVPPYVPPLYARRVLSSFVEGRLTKARTIELLRSMLPEAELPVREPMPLENLLSEFAPLP